MVLIELMSKLFLRMLQLPPDAWSDFQNQFLQEPAIELGPDFWVY